MCIPLHLGPPSRPPHIHSHTPTPLCPAPTHPFRLAPSPPPAGSTGVLQYCSIHAPCTATGTCPPASRTRGLREQRREQRQVDQAGAPGWAGGWAGRVVCCSATSLCPAPAPRLPRRPSHSHRRSSMWQISSGVLAAEMLVKPTMSENRTVTCGWCARGGAGRGRARSWPATQRVVHALIGCKRARTRTHTRCQGTGSCHVQAAHNEQPHCSPSWLTSRGNKAPPACSTLQNSPCARQILQTTCNHIPHQREEGASGPENPPIHPAGTPGWLYMTVGGPRPLLPPPPSQLTHLLV